MFPLFSTIISAGYGYLLSVLTENIMHENPGVILSLWGPYNTVLIFIAAHGSCGIQSQNGISWSELANHF